MLFLAVIRACWLMLGCQHLVYMYVGGHCCQASSNDHDVPANQADCCRIVVVLQRLVRMGVSAAVQSGGLMCCTGLPQVVLRVVHCAQVAQQDDGVCEVAGVAAMP
jgi:hypothetical protein